MIFGKYLLVLQQSNHNVGFHSRDSNFHGLALRKDQGQKCQWMHQRYNKGKRVLENIKETVLIKSVSDAGQLTVWERCNFLLFTLNVWLHNNSFFFQRRTSSCVKVLLV